MRKPPPYTLRTAQAADYAMVGAWITDPEVCRRWGGPQLAYPFRCEELPDLLKATKENTFCLLDPARHLTGFGQILSRAPGTVHLMRIIVDPAARGHGVGQTLCQLLMAQALRMLGPDRFTLRVYPDNVPALRTYQRLGFITIDADPETGVLLMQKCLDR